MPPKKTPEELHALSRSKRSYKEVNWAIKKLDSEPLLRQDIQWQVLDDIFADRSIRFTAPVDHNSPPADPVYLNFDQLYLEAILSSMKTTAATRSKLISNTEFATNYSKLCLLINVGRVNTTLAFYPQMKTALRTYHPIPSLQTEEVSRREMSDAPRLKAMLKMAFLDWEVNNAPTTLRAVAEKANDPLLTRGPPTTVIEAIFLVFQEPQWVSERYFPKGFDVWDIFFPSDMPSQPRARAFLSLMHHILEDKSFLSDFSPALPTPIPLTPPIVLSRDPAPTKENIDSASELEFAREMRELRSGVVATVPAIQKKAEEDKEKLAKQREREEALQMGVAPNALAGGAGGSGMGGANDGTAIVGPGGGKRRRVEKKKMSYAKTIHQQRILLNGTNEEILPPSWEKEDWNAPVPQTSALPLTWFQVKRDMYQNRDPDYDSDEEEAWSYDLLRRRKTLRTLNPETGRLDEPKNIKDYEEWVRTDRGQIKDEEYDGGAGDTSMAYGHSGQGGAGGSDDDE
ncbi:Ies1p [Sporobolomyces salmoneus]|uniref:Ies1p n=1 Tax=Sporobolomyces salmoneus TaxID=183962 RepID=UPI0031736E47